MKNIIIFIFYSMYRMRRANLTLEERVLVCYCVVIFGLSLALAKWFMCDYRQDLVHYKRGNLDLLKWTEFCSCWLNLQISLRSWNNEILHRNSYLNLEKIRSWNKTLTRKIKITYICVVLVQSYVLDCGWDGNNISNKSPQRRELTPTSRPNSA